METCQREKNEKEVGTGLGTETEAGTERETEAKPS